MEFTEQQEQALTLAGKWLSNPRAPQIFRLFGYAGTGKAQPLTAMIQTPNGPVRMGDLNVGDEILGKDGHSVYVTGVFPQGIKPVYTITFRDGSKTECSGEHLWRVTNGQYERKKMEPLVLTTEEIIHAGVRWPSGDRRWRIPLCEPVEYDSSPAPFDAYTIGVLLGDGYVKGNIVCFYCNDKLIVERVKSALPDELYLTSDWERACGRHVIKSTSTDHCNVLRWHLESRDMIVGAGEKKIPRDYLYAPIEDRLSLLRGLMDTDGSISEGNRASFSTTSPSLAADMRTLVQSLGGTVITKETQRVDRKSVEFHLNVKMLINPFHLLRKAERWRPSDKNPPSRFIESIERTGNAEQQCISVSAVDSLYLTDEFIVTHNTTIAKEISRMARGFTVFGAYTGKAALVLRSKGCMASTIHSLIYKCDDPDPACPQCRGMKFFPAGTEIKCTKCGGTGDAPAGDMKPVFRLNPESPIIAAGLVIIDECSMVGEDIGADLLSFGKRVLVLGDPAQLPPVSGGGFFTEAEPDYMLTDIRRQALDDPIVRMSMDVREGRDIVPGTYGDSKVILRRDLQPGEVMAADQVLCGLNNTRRGLNSRFRHYLGYTESCPDFPHEGDRLVCLKNDRERQLYNGSLWTATNPRMQERFVIMSALSADEGGPSKPVPVVVPIEYFHGTEKNLPYNIQRRYDAFDFGYALTVHKSQGSAWPHVMVFDESHIFRENAKRHLYTAITRASQKVTIVL